MCTCDVLFAVKNTDAADSDRKGITVALTVIKSRNFHRWILIPLQSKCSLNRCAHTVLETSDLFSTFLFLFSQFSCKMFCEFAIFIISKEKIKEKLYTNTHVGFLNGHVFILYFLAIK